ncbi:trace amine-associated receptor 13c-like [Patiria miniata]|uniref:G-protein coupled receptors family 1 profile domain-containing protein n=1 Tax=Patiria miniata TaxID=46514 RepID=A0A913ZJE0_PATMI|nr:trace amine-associated receptor 13c-like [Patiria miniata]
MASSSTLDTGMVSNTTSGFLGVEVESGSSDLALVILAVFLAMLVTCLNLTLNSLMLLALRRVTSLDHTTKIFMASLTLSDLCTGLCSILRLPEIVSGAWMLGDFVCAARDALQYFFQTLSIFSLCLLTIDRYIAITRPLQYPTIMTVFRSKVIVCLTWTFSTVWGILVYGVFDRSVVVMNGLTLCVWQSSNWRVYLSVVFLLLVLFTIFGLYVHISIIARRHARRIAAENQAGNGAFGHRIPHQMSFRLATTVIIITGTLVVTWLPSIVRISIQTSQEGAVTYNSFLIGTLTDILFLSNCWLNVVIYYLRNRDLRQALHNLISSWKCKLCCKCLP